LVLQGIGDLQGARSHLERALAIDEAVYGPDHPDVATDLNNLGSLFLQHDNLYAAQTFLERSNKILRKYLGLEHPKTISTQKALKVIAELLERPYK
jgi:tetratricopeptide (TPR) repeat protein